MNRTPAAFYIFYLIFAVVGLLSLIFPERVWNAMEKMAPTHPFTRWLRPIGIPYMRVSGALLLLFALVLTYLSLMKR